MRKLLFLATMVITLAIACKKPKPKPTELDGLKHSIKISEAMAMVERYQKMKDSITKLFNGNPPAGFTSYETFNGKEIKQLLDADSSIGLRVYYGLDSNNNFRVILTGVSSGPQRSPCDYYPKDSSIIVAKEFGQTCSGGTCLIRCPQQLTNTMNPHKNN